MNRFGENVRLILVRHLLLLSLSLLAVGTISEGLAQVPKLAKVPANLSPEQAAELNSTREILLYKLKTLQSRAAEFNSTCGEVTAGSSQERWCETQRQQLESERLNYAQFARQFNARIEGSGSPQTERKPPTPPAKPALINTLTNVKGMVWIETSDGRIFSKDQLKAENLLPGATLVTGPDGSVTLQLVDNHTLTLGAETKMTPEKKTIRDGNEENVVFQLYHGTVALFGSYDEHSRQILMRDKNGYHLVNIGLSCAVAGVRGTQFDALVKKDGSGYLKLISGKLDILPRNGQAAFEMNGGQKIEFDSDGNILGPTPLK